MEYFDEFDAFDREQEADERQEREELEGLWAAAENERVNEGDGGRNVLDPFSIPNREFKIRYRFDKDNVRIIADIVRPHIHLFKPGDGMGAGRPTLLSVEQIVCLGLEFLAGGHFFRVEGVCSGISTAAAWNYVYRFVDALNHPDVRNRFIYMPSQRMREENAAQVFSSRFYRSFHAILQTLKLN